METASRGKAFMNTSTSVDSKEARTVRMKLSGDFHQEIQHYSTCKMGEMSIQDFMKMTARRYMDQYPMKDKPETPKQ